MQRHNQPTEAGYLVGVQLKNDAGAWSLESSMEELAALAESAGVDVVGAGFQRLDRPHPSTLVGSGKLDELKLAVTDTGATVILFDHELSPRQQRNLEAAFDLMVIDRTALILDVFARHARTREGMLQVELAQYEYRLPRLTRLWTHLARQAGGRAGGASGGVGVRGPGETQLEIDRREIRRRIALLSKSLEDLRAQRRRSRESRLESGQPLLSLVGYTNAGKSTLLNALTDAQVYTADQLFATLDPTTRRVKLPSGRQALVSDTVGFIQKLPTQLIAAFRATLEEVTEADLLVHVIDTTHPDAVRQAETVERILTDLGALSTVPMVVAANKIDALDGDLPPELLDLYPDLVPISAAKRQGLEALLSAIDTELQSHLAAVDVLIPYAAGELLHRIHQSGVILDEASDEHGTRVRARVPHGLAAALAGYAVSAAAPTPRI